MARAAEEAGFAAIFTTEVNNNALATAQLMGSATAQFIGDDLDSLRDLARQNLGLYTAFPYFQRMWRESGFGAEADQMEKGAGQAALSDRLLDSFCLFGPVARCQERLSAYRAAGVTLPILNPPIGPDAALAVIRAFGG